MDALTLLDKILSSKYPILGLLAVITYYVIKGFKKAWPGFTKFVDKTVDRYFTDKEQQFEVQIELEIQIKSLIATQNALQEQLKAMIEQNEAFKQFLGELSHKLEFLSEGFWENRRTIEAYFKKTDAIWSQIGVIPL